MLRIIAFLLPLALLSFSLNRSAKSDNHAFYQTLKVDDTLKFSDMIFADFLSPNGDGYNDTYVIYNLENWPGNSIKIFNRWGETVYKAEPYKNDWNGKNNQSGPLFGNDCSEGVYYFEFYNGNGNKASGKITLKR